MNLRRRLAAPLALLWTRSSVEVLSVFELTRPPTGQVLDRRTRLVHNGRWHLLEHGRHVKVGWGDLSLADLTEIRTQLGRGLFLAVREEADPPPDGSAWWGDYDRLDHGPLPVGGCRSLGRRCTRYREGG